MSYAMLMVTEDCRYCGMETCDCVDRIQCPVAGKPGHRQCGVCPEHNQPRFVCGCEHEESKKDRM